ncbi:hypothetical protein [Dysgonomonas sp. GY617]|uniref:hypothetical protein n=1 Tax=Dysgonomonas sp. GY617 TaxID=2780420 RepID=UPI001883549A|nr:hypothetical protein [Dysgonomonas sp. GY617]MBF0574839.1 hypothetical protein [Dysgonomonas sp. GY617]
MKKKIYNYLTLTTVLLSLYVTEVSAQSVGINTNTPTAALDIFSLGDSNLTENMRISNSSNVNLLTLLNNGYLGLGTTSPSVRLDLRGSAGSNNIIGIGNTNLTASVAEGGAIKYVTDTKELHYSDGTQWLILEADMVRDCVIAANSNNMMICPNNTTTQLGNWDVKYDLAKTFDAATGVFTAPKTGLYTATFSVHTAITTVKAGSYIEGQWIASNGKTIKCTNSFPLAGNFMVPMICSGTLFLNEGDTLYPQVFHNTGTDKHLRIYGDTPGNPVSDQYFNNISIVIQ